MFLFFRRSRPHASLQHSLIGTVCLLFLRVKKVMPLIGWCPQPLCMLTDLMEGGTSIEYLRNKNWEPQEAIVKLLYDVAKGMTHLHSLNIVHSDLKPQNILVDSSGKAKVSDFGMSKMREHSTAAAHSQFRGGTLVFIAPEIFRDAKRSFKSDVYAFGITAWMLLSEGASPFTGIGNIVQVRAAHRSSKKRSLPDKQTGSI